MLDRPVHGPETVDGTEAPVVSAPVVPGTSAHDGLAEVHHPPRLLSLGPPPTWWSRPTRYLPASRLRSDMEPGLGQGLRHAFRRRQRLSRGHLVG